jgi:hypothetical protein
MKQSESIANLAAALVGLQDKLEHPKKTASNPHLRNKFADLGSVIDTNRAILSQSGLMVVQATDAQEGSVGVTTRLIHESGEWIESSCYIPLAEQKGLNLAQVAGSAITYLRRYGWQTILGLNGEPDDDGNEGAGQPDTAASSNGNGAVW